MKKKIVSVLLIISFILVLVPKTSSAKDVNNSIYSFYIPNKYEAGYENVTKTSSFKSYHAYEGDDYTSITFSAYKYYNLKPYTQTDVNNRVSSIKKSYSNDEYSTLTSISGKLIELNGVKGYRVTYYVKYKSSGNVYVHDEYELRSDNYSSNISVSTGKTFINSAGYKKIINSFKVKDTVLKSKGIPYTDVSSSAWYYNAVKYVYEKNLVNGYNDYTYAPYDKLSRAMLVTILWRKEGSPKYTSNKFSDVKSKDWYYQAVNWAASKGIVSGYKTGKFGPKDNITREQLAAILMNYAKYKGKNTSARANTSKFKDFSKTGKYFKDAVSWCVAKKIISGKENGTKVDPKGNATRAEAASMIMSYCQNVK